MARLAVRVFFLGLSMAVCLVGVLWAIDLNTGNNGYLAQICGNNIYFAKHISSCAPYYNRHTWDMIGAVFMALVGLVASIMSGVVLIIND